jgi:hypothetical protein
MSIPDVQVRELARIRIQMAEEKVEGERPLFQHHLESFQTAVVVWGLMLLLFLAAVGLYRVVERRNK